MKAIKPKLAVHKFTSCDGCQLAFINLGQDLLKLADAVDIVHFPEIGPVNPEAQVDFAFVEGSVSTPEEQKRIQIVRQNARYVITIGACATAGGIQALRNFADADEWMADVYAKPEKISTLATSTAIAKHIRVDLELWGCPASGKQVLDAMRSFLQKAMPEVARDSVCMECKRRGYICVLVSQGIPCMGPVTQTGCGALCPGVNRDCYACYGPSENPNTTSLSNKFANIGLSKAAIKRRFLFINNQAPAFLQAGKSDEKSD